MHGVEETRLKCVRYNNYTTPKVRRGAPLLALLPGRTSSRSGKTFDVGKRGVYVLK